jgi:hypothetical protein
MGNCEAVVMADSANVRVQPNTAGSIVGVLGRHSRVPAHRASDPDAQNMRWILVTIPSSGFQGWVRGDLVQLTGDCEALGVVSTTIPTLPTPTPPPVTPTPSPSTPTPIVLTGDCQAEVTVALANVRGEPKITGRPLGNIRRGTRFVVKAVCTPDSDGFCWYGVDFQGQGGWIRQDLLQLTGDCLDPHSHEEPQPTPVTPTPPPPPIPPILGCQAVVGLPQINVRLQAATSSGLLGNAFAGESLLVQEVTPAQPDGFRWVRVDFRGRSGFVRSDLVTLQGNCAALTNDDRLQAPVAATITQGFKAGHLGFDFGAPVGTELKVLLPARIERAHPCTKCTPAKPNIRPANNAERDAIFADPGWGFGYGNHIIVSHQFSDLPRSTQEQILRKGGRSSNKMFVLYAHLTQMNVRVNQQLSAGTVIGTTGHTGNSTNPHLHIEVAFGDQWGSSQKVHPMLLFAVPNITS